MKETAVISGPLWKRSDSNSVEEPKCRQE